MKLGILGGGQLARMLSLSAHPLGIHTICLDPSSEACASEVTQVITAPLTDEKALDQLLENADYVTIETENIPLSCVEYVTKSKTFYPSVKALAVSQDRLLEKQFLKSLSIPTAAFYDVSSKERLQQAYSELGHAILKTRRLGYDGKGQCVLKSQVDLERGWQTLRDQELIVEQLIPFEFEVSLIGVRNKEKKISFYPLVRNHHKEGILRWSEVPVDKPHLQKEAEGIVTAILTALDYVGVLSVEFFYDGKQLLVNEMAPRVHNSGHWTLEGACTSQFENHLRAIFGLPIGSTEAIGHSFMLNCIGEMPSINQCLNIPGAHYHQYGKESRPNRKLGHVTLVDTNTERFRKSKQQLMALGALS
ncbi:5-(carboxyamino)imidazole ribonucleotide synthase [Legionella waltersii]|uniref:N5-carboxyaminoimidazole ribonucleotide synthase n=1 Tax=Legionella waltersii TaxID=66969 RepID=A0A0W0ZZU8_9GAMM|nr:5-(carboxyamino)imidazole ribonucleotide synthase [Legionella waltersii]KTD74642.1 phosphoribosylaminoimidazole carboxylase ATPase subunit [Legionella waltersii]SNV08972.1 phosphoribosylaminoimidazole carboxylase ATPase subunit [Legionella waltersii]